jgi:hypothetical protein
LFRFEEPDEDFIKRYPRTIKVKIRYNEPDLQGFPIDLARIRIRIGNPDLERRYEIGKS